MEKLGELRSSLDIKVKDMVDVVKRTFPKYDKTIQSKCENSDLYGVVLRKEAMIAILKEFAPEKLKPKERHRLRCRISCRLEDNIYEKLQLYIEDDGYSTMQEFLSEMISDYIKRKENTKDV